ncbi:MAG: MlaD family protein, partial [Bacteroidota bacterium]
MRREIKVGLTVIMGIGLAYLSLAWLNRSSLFAPPEKQYFLQFQQVNGLLEGDPVVVRGYQAGRVTNILPASEAVSVEIVLDERIPIFADALAEIQIKELMGGKQIALQTGKTGAALAEGATITGQTSLDFSTAFSRFGGVMDQVAPENVERFSQRIDSIATSWNAAIDPQTLSSIIQNLDRITTRLDQQTAQIPVNTLVEETQTTFSEVKGLLAQTSSLLSKLDQISTRLDSSFLGQGESL